MPYRAIAGGLAVALLTLALPQAGASLLRLYAEADARVPLLHLADDWFGAPQARIRAGLYELQRGEAEAAAADLASGLRRSPGDALAWAALGEARLASGDRDGAAAALKASILLGPYEPGLELSRAALALALWPGLDAETRRLGAFALGLAWDRDPKALLALARRGGDALPVMTALSSDPARLQAFLKALAAHP